MLGIRQENTLASLDVIRMAYQVSHLDEGGKIITFSEITFYNQ